MVKYRQPIRLGDTGLDVLAGKRALRRMGAGAGLALSPKAGRRWVAALQLLQRAHRLHADGVYGAQTHALVAPHFDAYGNWLYRHAQLRKHVLAGYVNPFHAARIQTGRIDQGVDFHGYGPICALGNARIIGVGGEGWPGGVYLLYQLRDGPHAGKYVYVAEAITVHAQRGTHVAAGQQVATFAAGAAPGRFPGIETGWGSPTVNLTLAAQLGNTGGAHHEYAPAGLAFARLLHQLGVPGLAVGAGPTYP